MLAYIATIINDPEVTIFCIGTFITILLKNPYKSERLKLGLKISGNSLKICLSSRLIFDCSRQFILGWYCMLTRIERPHEISRECRRSLISRNPIYNTHYPVYMFIDRASTISCDGTTDASFNYVANITINNKCYYKFCLHHENSRTCSHRIRLQLTFASNVRDPRVRPRSSAVVLSHTIFSHYFPWSFWIYIWHDAMS